MAPIKKENKKEERKGKKRNLTPGGVFPNQLSNIFRPACREQINKSTGKTSSSLQTSKMSGAQYLWTDHLNVPRTEEEWKTFANKAQFELSSKQRTAVINQKKEQLIKQAQNDRIAFFGASSLDVKERPKISDHLKRKIHLKTTKHVKGLLHWGKHPSEVHMRDLGGWDSTSKLRFSWFLTTVILFQFVPVRGTNLFETLSTSSVQKMNILSWNSAPTTLKTNRVQKLKTKPTSL